MSRKSDNGGCVLAALFAALIGLLASIGLFITTKLFEYSLWTITGKDIPWYGDLVGGVVLNGLNLPIAAICWILQMCGLPTPFHPIS